MKRLIGLSSLLAASACAHGAAPAQMVPREGVFVMAESILRRAETYVWTFFPEDRSMPRRLEVRTWRSEPDSDADRRGLLSVRVEGCGRTGPLVADETQLQPIRGDLRFAWVTASGSVRETCSPGRLRLWFWMNDAEPDTLEIRQELWLLSWAPDGRPLLEQRPVAEEPWLADPDEEGSS